MRKLVIVGNGKLADAIEKEYPSLSHVMVSKFHSNIEADDATVFVHVGSGRQYRESLEKAVSKGSSYIQAATEKDIKMDPPKDGSLIYIQAPNLDTHIIKLFYWLKMGQNLFKDEVKSIIESHQKEKLSAPGTALKFCDYLKIPRQSLISIREPEEQKSLQIQNLAHHAFHRIQIGDENSMIRIETKIEGATSYVQGLFRIVDSIQSLQKGNYEIDELIRLNLL